VAIVGVSMADAPGHALRFVEVELDLHAMTPLLAPLPAAGRRPWI
jgi:hypothetical protein